MCIVNDVMRFCDVIFAAAFGLQPDLQQLTTDAMLCCVVEVIIRSHLRSITTHQRGFHGAYCFFAKIEDEDGSI